MTTVTPQMVKELREQTGAGMSECKKALDQASGNMEQAVQILRERGLAAAAKKASRAASEGVVSALVLPQGDVGIAVEVNCETDFVTRNDDFKALVETVVSTALQHTPQDLEALLKSVTPTGQTIQDIATASVAKIGENIQVRRFARVGTGNGLVSAYVHAGGKVGVLVELQGSGISGKRANEHLQEVAKDVALQVAAMKPQFLNRTVVPAEVVAAESEVFTNQYRNQGKPENILPKIVASRIDTWFKEACLVEQPFVKDDSKTVGAHIAEAGKKVGIADLAVGHFVRLELGQGVEKKSVDFATEVAAQIKGH